MDPRKAAQRQCRLFHLGIYVAKINLRHLVTVNVSGVLHRKTYVRHAVVEDMVGRQLPTGEIELRVTQAVAESIERLSAEIAVGPVGHRVIGERWQIRRRPVKGNWQMARGIQLTEKGF